MTFLASALVGLALYPVLPVIIEFTAEIVFPVKFK